ncbi:MAG TPA: hypothetical protein VNI60_05790 [Pyrinomonadaceae bacterium]|nr:hypothetical protein [Pyrinomonadaceae bacterium]
MKEVKRTKAQLKNRREEINAQLNKVNKDLQMELDRDIEEQATPSRTGRSFEPNRSESANRVKRHRRKVGGGGRRIICRNITNKKRELTFMFNGGIDVGRNRIHAS